MCSPHLQESRRSSVWDAPGIAPSLEAADATSNRSRAAIWSRQKVVCPEFHRIALLTSVNDVARAQTFPKRAIATMGYEYTAGFGSATAELGVKIEHFPGWDCAPCHASQPVLT